MFHSRGCCARYESFLRSQISDLGEAGARVLVAQNILNDLIELMEDDLAMDMGAPIEIPGCKSTSNYYAE